MSETIRVSREQALAFRLSGHHLAKRELTKSLEKIAAACGVRNTPPGSAALGLLARLDGLTLGDVDQALDEKGELVEVLSVRISPLLTPRKDIEIFTTGALPRTDASLESALVNFKPAFNEAGVTPRNRTRTGCGPVPGGNRSTFTAF